MHYQNINATDAWLQRNLHRQETAFADTRGSIRTSDGFRVRVLRLMLAIAAVAVAVMWHQDETLKLVSIVDRIGYPILFAATSLGSLFLTVRPGSFHAVVTTVFAALTIYLLASYYYILFYQGIAAEPSGYMLATLALWLPFCYVAGYVFFSPQGAMRTSLTIYAAISLPLLLTTGMDATSLGHQIAFAMLVSHPVYIAALWGVAQLKLHALGVHDLAHSMSVAATEDPLTGVANRRAMLHALHAVTRELSATGQPLALLMLDVDRFKGVNDRFGHTVGDEVLMTLAREARTHLRASDLLGRWGGEEFMILSLEQSQPQALQMAERLRGELEKITYPLAGTVTVSIGVTMFVPGESVDTLFKRADDALYLAKERGRNRVEGLFGGNTPSP